MEKGVGVLLFFSGSDWIDMTLPQIGNECVPVILSTFPKVTDKGVTLKKRGNEGYHEETTSIKGFINPGYTSKGMTTS